VLTEWLLLGAGVLLTIATGVFVAAEFSLIALDRPQVEREAESGDRSAARVLVGLRTLSTQPSGAQVGITVTTLLVGYLVEPSLSRLLERPLTATGLPEGAVSPVSVGVGMFLATLASMLVGELVPKNLAISLPMATARWSVPLQRAFTWLTKPLIVLLNGSANRILRSWGIEPQEELSSGRSPQELVFLVRRSAEAGTLDEGTANLLTRTLGFSQHTAADVMTDRTRMQSVRRDDTAEHIVTLARTTGLSRFPVTDESADDVVGVVHLKRAVAVPRDKRSDVPAAALMNDALRVPETVRLDPLLADLRSHGLQLAVVTDEYGGTAGVVTLEDVVEELVGEVADEHDKDRGGVQRARDGSYLLPGQMRPDEVRDRLAVDVPDDHSYETVAGFIVSRLGRLAQVGDEVQLDEGRLRVDRLTGRRIERVRFTPVPPPHDETTGADGATARGGAR
jgi:CBS domain containing-hemolysin-like protein